MEPQPLFHASSKKKNLKLIDFLGDYSSVVVAGKGGSLSFLHFLPRFKTETIKVTQNAITALKIYKEQKDILIGDLSGNLMLVTISEQKKYKETKKHYGKINDIAISPLVPLIATGANDGTVKLFKYPELSLLGTMQGNKLWISSVQFVNNGKYIVTTSNDRKIRIYDVSSYQLIEILPELPCIPTCFSICPLQRSMFIGLMRGTIVELNTKGDIIESFCPHKSVVTSISIHPNGRFLLTSSDDSRICLIDIERCESVMTLEAHHSHVSKVCWCDDGIHFASCDFDGRVLIWTLPSIEKFSIEVLTPKKSAAIKQVSPIIPHKRESKISKIFDENDDTADRDEEITNNISDLLPGFPPPFGSCDDDDFMDRNAVNNYMNSREVDFAMYHERDGNNVFKHDEREYQYTHLSVSDDEPEDTHPLSDFHNNRLRISTSDEGFNYDGELGSDARRDYTGDYDYYYDEEYRLTPQPTEECIQYLGYGSFMDKDGFKRIDDDSNEFNSNYYANDTEAFLQNNLHFTVQGDRIRPQFYHDVYTHLNEYDLEEEDIIRSDSNTYSSSTEEEEAEVKTFDAIDRKIFKGESSSSSSGDETGSSIVVERITSVEGEGVSFQKISGEMLQTDQNHSGNKTISQLASSSNTVVDDEDCDDLFIPIDMSTLPPKEDATKNLGSHIQSHRILGILQQMNYQIEILNHTAHEMQRRAEIIQKDIDMLFEANGLDRQNIKLKK